MLSFLMPLAYKVVDSAVAKIPEDAELGEDTDFADIDPRWPIQCPYCLAYYTRLDPESCNCEN